MKKIVSLFICLSSILATAQNGFTTYTTNLSLTGIVVKQTSFIVDNSNNKWVGYRSANLIGNVGLIKYDNSTWTLYNTTSSPALPSNYVTALAKDNAGNIWIGTADAGLVKYDGTTFSTYNMSNGLPTNSITCIETSGNQVYIGTNVGLSRFDGANFTNYSVSGGSLPTNAITSIVAENAGLLWLGAVNELIEFNINGTFTSTSYVDHIVPQTPYYRIGTPSSAGIINCIHIDSQNSKWLGSTTAGIIKYDGTTFKNANELYEIYGSIIPMKVTDLETGFHSGIIFKHTIGSVNNSNNSGLTELTPNGKVYQYFHPISNYNFGDFLERDGSAILISKPQTTSPLVYTSFNESNYTMPIGSINVDNFKTLDINNVKAGISNRSDMHWDIGGAQNAMYEVPKGSGKHSNFASALWIGGLDNGGQLHGGAQTYRQSQSGGVDFWPGPLDTINGTIDTATSLNYDKIWKVSYTDINNFITAFNSGSVIATPDMLTWPAHGTGNNSRKLAPFVDHNSDGVYNPNDGDYPKIKGDQTLYFIYNDMLATHGSSYTPMGVEVQVMAYAYGCPDIVNGHNELTYTTFYDYKITNRSSNNYHDVYVSMFSDVDLGYYADDYIGSNVADNYGYAYNGDSFDEGIWFPINYDNYIPAQGFNIVKGPIANLNDGIDNNNNGVIDEIGEDCKMNKFNYFRDGNSSVPTPETNAPIYPQQYYNYMSGFWADTTSFTCGSNGYGGTTPSNWVYPGDPNNAGVSTDPNNTCGYWKETGVAGDRRLILSSGPFTLNAGQMQEVEYAFVTSFDSSSTTNSNLLSVAKLKTDIQKVNAFYNLVNKPNCLQTIVIGVSELLKQNDFALFPNPAKSLITVSSTINGTIKINYEVVDVLGKVVLQNENTSSEKFSININDLTSGIYFLRLQVNNSVVVKKFVKE